MKMKLNSESVREWFGFTRRERRSASVLLVIIIFIIGLRYVLPEKNIEIEDYGLFLADTEITRLISDQDISSGNMLFSFNPASASYDTLEKSGFAESKANAPIRYRSGGGRFRKPSAGQQKPLLDINSCDSFALVSLPGIGPILSVRIIKYRNLLGGFARVDQLKEVYGLPEETYEMIKGRLYADSSGIRKININSSGYKELIRLPYIEKYEVTAILKYRELTGRIKSIVDLEENKILAAEKAEKVKPYLDFR
jgi:DNA uptake protein ComE-like DNA-binding protein